MELEQFMTQLHEKEVWCDDDFLDYEELEEERRWYDDDYPTIYDEEE